MRLNAQSISLFVYRFYYKNRRIIIFFTESLTTRSKCEYSFGFDFCKRIYILKLLIYYSFVKFCRFYDYKHLGLLISANRSSTILQVYLWQYFFAFKYDGTFNFSSVFKYLIYI